jgi:hypothetical protein
MELAVNNQRIALSEAQAKALRRALGYHLARLVESLRDKPRTAVTVLLETFKQDDWDHSQADVIAGPKMARFSIRVGGMTLDVGQAEALRAWKQLETATNKDVALADEDWFVGLADWQ